MLRGIKIRDDMAWRTCMALRGAIHMSTNNFLFFPALSVLFVCFLIRYHLLALLAYFKLLPSQT